MDESDGIKAAGDSLCLACVCLSRLCDILPHPSEGITLWSRCERHPPKTTYKLKKKKRRRHRSLDILGSSSCDIFQFGPADVTSCLGEPVQTSSGMRRGVRRREARESSCQVHKVTPERSFPRAGEKPASSVKWQLSSHLARSGDVLYFSINSHIHILLPPHVMRWRGSFPDTLYTHLRPRYVTSLHSAHTSQLPVGINNK